MFIKLKNYTIGKLLTALTFGHLDIWTWSGLCSIGPMSNSPIVAIGQCPISSLTTTDSIDLIDLTEKKNKGGRPPNSIWEILIKACLLVLESLLLLVSIVIILGRAGCC